MFVTPLSLPAPGSVNLRPLLMAWMLFGTAALLFNPSLAFDARFGATLSFWLVGAPAIDLAWILRARIASAVHGAWTWCRAVRVRRQARRTRFAQSLGCSRSERSSRK